MGIYVCKATAIHDLLVEHFPTVSILSLTTCLQVLYPLFLEPSVPLPGYPLLLWLLVKLVQRLYAFWRSDDCSASVTFSQFQTVMQV